MEKRKTQDLDEEAILGMMGNDIPRLRAEPKSTPEPETLTVIDDSSMTESPTPSPVKFATDGSNVPTKQKRRRNSQDYSGMFLRKREPAQKRQTYINAALFAKITEILAVVASDLTVPTFLDNLLTNHLEQYRDDINELYSSKIKTPL